MVNRSNDLLSLSTNTLNQLDHADLIADPLQSASYTAASTSVDVGNTPITATDLGIIANRTIRGSVGNGDDGDLYRFEVGNIFSAVDFVLNGLSADADLTLFQDSNKDGKLDANEQLRYSGNFGTTPDRINIAALASGEYYLRVSPFLSSSTAYTLNITTDFAESGDTIATATEVGILSGQRILSGSVGIDDRRDLYSIRLNNRSNLEITLSGLSNDADLAVYRDFNNNGILDSTDLLRTSAAFGTRNEQLNLTDLAAGNYFISISQFISNTSYILTATSDTAGSTLSTARNLGLITDSQTITEFVGAIDPSDIYRFQLNTTSNLQIRLDNLAEDADISLIRDANNNGAIDFGETLGISLRAGTQTDSIAVDLLAAGNYFVVVNRGLMTSNTNYRLNLAADAVSTLQRLEGDLNANLFRPSASVDRIVISGNGNLQFGQGYSDVIDLSNIDFTSIRLDLAGLNQGGVAYNPGNGTRIFDAINFSDGRQILFEGIDAIQFSDRRINLSVNTNDPLFRSQWSLHGMGVQNAWRFTTGTDRVLIGVGDSGLGLNSQGNFHPDLRTPLVFPNNYRDDFEDRDLYSFDPLTSHGTAIQSIISAISNNGVGLSGINWNSPVLSIDVLGGDLNDRPLAEAVQAMINNRRPGQMLVINLSLESLFGTSPALEALVSQNQADVLFVIASGNSARSSISNPASLAIRYRNVIAVGAVDRQADRFSYSNYGTGLTLSAPSSVVAANATQIGSTVRFDYTDSSGGTSSAAPNVTGVASLVWSANPNLTATQVRDILSSTAYDLGNPGYDTTYGAGFVNADAAVRRAIALA